MSYLIRTGTGRIDIDFDGGLSSPGNYLSRYGSNRSDIQYRNVTENDDELSLNIFERYGTGRNDVRFINSIFSFKSKQEEMMDLLFNTINTMIIPSNEVSSLNNKFNMIIYDDSTLTLLKGIFVKYDKYWILEYTIVDNNTSNFPQIEIYMTHGLILQTKENYYDFDNEYKEILQNIMIFSGSNTLMKAAYFSQNNIISESNSTNKIYIQGIGYNRNINFNNIHLRIVYNDEERLLINPLKPMYFKYP